MKNKHNKSAAKIGIPALVCGIVLSLLSCAGDPEAYNDIDAAVVYSNDFEKGLEAIRKGQEGRYPVYPERNAISLFLDRGLLEHYAGHYRESSIDLQEAERLIEEAYTRSISESIASYIANDNTKTYPGEDYEDIYINVFNALNYYNRGDLEGAMVEIRKITISNGKLDLLSRKYENARPDIQDWVLDQLRHIGILYNPELPQGQAVNFSNSALARYLSLLFYLGDGKADDARIEFEQLRAAYSSNPNIYKTLIPVSAAEAMNVPPGKARLNIISFVGLSPIKEEGTFQNVFPFFQNSYLRSTVFKLPKFTERKSDITGIEVVVRGSGNFSLELLEDMGAVIRETYNARFSNLFFKTYIRTMLKYAAADVSATRAAERRSSSAAMLSAIIAKSAIDASESADIRMSRYLPDKAYIGGVNLEPGNYTVTVNYLSGRRIIAGDEHRNVIVRPGVLNLIESVSLR
ncbi:MAG: hypothetical protein LBQ94_08335 [Treponema sp.]|nr:hypothetical protein [Treponema sp.]